MNPRTVFKLTLLGLVVLIFASIFTAFAAGITIPESNATYLSFPVTAEDIKPPACSALFLTNIVRGSGAITGTAGNDLILGSSGNDTIDGMGGDDCIEGAAGDDTIDGNTGTDICLGGAGTDTFSNCETEIQ